MLESTAGSRDEQGVDMETYRIRHLDGAHGDLLVSLTTRGGAEIRDAQGGIIHRVSPAQVRAKGDLHGYVENRYRARKSDRFWWTGIDQVL